MRRLPNRGGRGGRCGRVQRKQESAILIDEKPAWMRRCLTTLDDAPESIMRYLTHAVDANADKNMYNAVGP